MQTVLGCDLEVEFFLERLISWSRRTYRQAHSRTDFCVRSCPETVSDGYLSAQTNAHSKHRVKLDSFENVNSSSLP